jgi:hypothetical protein
MTLHRLVWIMALVACDGGLFGPAGFRVRQATCSSDVADLSRDLTFHLQQGDSSGAFDYRVLTATIGRVSGEYDFETGDFAWTETGTEVSWVDRIDVAGYGYASTNGDLDIMGTRVVVDVLGREDHQQFRVERNGCRTLNRTRRRFGMISRETIEEGLFLLDRYTYTATTDIDGSVREVVGELFPDRTFVEQISFYQENYSIEAEREGSHLLGTSTRTFSEVFDATTSRVGTESMGPDGGREVTYTQTAPSGTTVWTYKIDYAGDGRGTMTGSDFTCSLRFEKGECTYDCDGDQGRC